MTNAIAAQGTVLKVGTGSGGAKTITGITLGAITEIISAAHGLAVGDVVALASIVGTTQLNGLTPMIIAVETNSIFVNIDSSGFTAYTSGGTATPVAWTAVGEIADFDGPGGSASIIDVSHLSSTRKEKLMGLPDSGQFTFSLNRVFSNTGQQALETAWANRTLKDFQVTYPDTTVQSFSGYVLSFSSSGAVDDKISGSVTIEITGEVTTA